MALALFTKILTQIFENQKGYRVQTSVHLKKLEQYLFDKSCPKLSNPEIEVLFLGIPDKKIMGLYGLAGIKATVSGLKKSSFYALQIILKIITSGKNQEVASKFFSESDEEDFKLLRLATHILESKTTTALELCALLKDKRPYLSQNNYIYSEEAKEKFQKWYKQRPKPKKQDIKKKTQLIPSQTETPEKIFNNNNFKPSITQQHFLSNNGISTKLEDLQFLDFDILGSEEQYLLDTFLDPIDIWEYKKESKEFREKSAFEEYMMFLIETPISRVDTSKIEDRIMSIHMESPQFAPSVLIQKYHKNLTDKQKNELGKQIPHHIGSDGEKNFVKYFFSKFIQVQHELGQIKNNFDQTDKIRSQGNIGFSLRTKTKNSVKQLSSKVQPLYYRYIETEKLRKLILFLQQNSQFTKLSSTFSGLIEQNKISQIPILFNRYQNLLELYRERPILCNIIQNIQNTMLQARIKQVNIAIFPNIMQKQLETLLGLFSDKRKTLIEYIVPKIIHSILTKLPKKILSEDGKQSSKQTLGLQNKIKQFELLNFHELVPLKKKSILDDEGVEEGDLLEIFLNKKAQVLESYYGECLTFEKQILEDLTKIYEAMQGWQIKYNIFFEEKELLNKMLLNWCNSITSQINKTLTEYASRADCRNDQIVTNQEQKCVQVMCRIILLIQKYIQNYDLTQKMQELKLDNFQLFCKLLIFSTKNRLDFKPCAIKRDYDKNYYNDILVGMMGEILSGCQKIKKYPSFADAQNYSQGQKNTVTDAPTILKYEEKLYNYICECFEVDDTLLGNLPEILTYACVVNAIIEDKFLSPFYHQLKEFPLLKQNLHERSKKKSKRVKQLLNSYIKINYMSIITSNKYENFGISILNTLNEHIFLISEYANNNYKNLTRFFMESFQNQCENLLKSKEKLKAEFFMEMYLIKEMTNRIVSTRIKERWGKILENMNISNEEKEKQENQIYKLRYKNNITFKALIE